MLIGEMSDAMIVLNAQDRIVDINRQPNTFSG
jgi:hypothetical protein